MPSGPPVKSVKFINIKTYKRDMEDHFDKIPVQYRTERLGRLRGLITQIEADYKRCNYLKQKTHLRVSDHSEIEEMLKMETWIKRDMTIYKRLNAVSIEGITFVGVGEFSSCP